MPHSPETDPTRISRSWSPSTDRRVIAMEFIGGRVDDLKASGDWDRAAWSCRGARILLRQIVRFLPRRSAPAICVFCQAGVIRRRLRNVRPADALLASDRHLSGLLSQETDRVPGSLDALEIRGDTPTSARASSRRGGARGDLLQLVARQHRSRAAPRADCDHPHHLISFRPTCAPDPVSVSIESVARSSTALRHRESTTSATRLRYNRGGAYGRSDREDLQRDRNALARFLGQSLSRSARGELTVHFDLQHF